MAVSIEYGLPDLRRVDAASVSSVWIAVSMFLCVLGLCGVPSRLPVC